MCIAAMPFGPIIKKVLKTWRAILVRLWRIIRASFSQERMTYVAAQDSSDGIVKVIYQSKDAKTTKTFDALDWPALLNRVNNVNPLVCSKCLGSKKIISFIEDEQLVKKILKHLDLWDVKRKPPPCANGPPPEAFII